MQVAECDCFLTPGADYWWWDDETEQWLFRTRSTGSSRARATDETACAGCGEDLTQEPGEEQGA